MVFSGFFHSLNLPPVGGPYIPTFDVSTLTYTSNTLPITNRTEGVFIDPSGTYLSGSRESNLLDYVRFFQLTNPFNLSPYTTLGQLNVGNVVLKDATFNDTGSVLYYCIQNNRIYSVPMSSITNGANYHITSGTQSATPTGPYTATMVSRIGGIEWINGGTQMMVCDENAGTGNNDFHIIDASTSYDITTLSASASTSLHLRGLLTPASTDGISDVHLIENGHVLLFTLRTTGIIVECVLQTAYNFGTIAYYSQLQHDIGGTTYEPLTGVHVGNGKGFFAVGNDPAVPAIYNNVYEWA